MDDILNNQPVASKPLEVGPWRGRASGGGTGTSLPAPRRDSAHGRKCWVFMPEELTRGYQDFAERLHPQDRERVESAARRFIDGQAASYSGRLSHALQGRFVEMDSRDARHRSGVGCTGPRTAHDRYPHRHQPSKRRPSPSCACSTSNCVRTPSCSRPHWPASARVLCWSTLQGGTHVQRTVCAELLDLPKSLLDARPLLTEGDALPARAKGLWPRGPVVGEEACAPTSWTPRACLEKRIQPATLRATRVAKARPWKYARSNCHLAGWCAPSPTSATTSRCKPTGSA